MKPELDRSRVFRLINRRRFLFVDRIRFVAGQEALERVVELIADRLLSASERL